MLDGVQVANGVCRVSEAFRVPLCITYSMRCRLGFGLKIYTRVERATGTLHIPYLSQWFALALVNIRNIGCHGLVSFKDWRYMNVGKCASTCTIIWRNLNVGKVSSVSSAHWNEFSKLCFSAPFEVTMNLYLYWKLSLVSSSTTASRCVSQ